MALLFKITLLALASSALAASATKNGLSERDQQLAEITGSKNLEEIKKAFQQVFGSSDIDAVLQRISKVVERDAVSFLKFCNQITQKKTLQESSKVFFATTPQKQPLIDIWDGTRQRCFHDLQDFYARQTEQTGKKTLQEMFQVLVDLTGINDILVLLESGRKYTQYKDPIEIHDIEFKATHTKTLQECFATLIKATNSKNIFGAYDTLLDITKVDIVEIFKVMADFKVDSWDGFVKAITSYTGTKDFVSAMKAAPAVTGEKNSIDALKHIQQGLPPKNN